jgi:hypothetical protein
MGMHRLRLPLTGIFLGAIATAVVAPACQDPVHDQEVSALGPENPQVPRGQYHRAGQPCTVCHGPEGPAQTQFSVAGTIFWQPYAQPNGQNQGELGASNAQVSMVDSLGKQFAVVTNCVGNFWTTPAAFNPAFPIKVSVFTPELKGAPPMFSQISRAGSCAECHSDPPNYNALGHIYLGAGPVPAADVGAACPVDPNLADLGGGIP